MFASVGLGIHIDKMKYFQLILLMSGVYKSHGSCGLRHLFQPVSSEGLPCNPQNLDCIRIFFVNTWICLEREGLLPLFANITEFTFPATSSKMSVTGYGIEIQGIRTGRGFQMYYRPTNTLIISTEWPRINVQMKRVVVQHPGMENVTITDFFIRFDYILIMGTFLSSEITISRNVRTFVEKVHQPVFQHGPEQSTEGLNILVKVLLQDVTLMIQNFFVVRAANFMEYLITNNLCRPNGFMDSDASICGSVSRRRRNSLGQNSTVPSH